MPMEDTLKSIDTEHEPQPLQELKRAGLSALRRIAHDPRTHRVFDIATHKVEYVDDLLGVRTRHLDVHRSCRAHIEATFRHAQALGQLPKQPDALVLAVTYLALIDGLPKVTCSVRVEQVEGRTITTLEMIAPLGRLIETSEIATAVAFLASNDARHMTGAKLIVDGGLIHCATFHMMPK